MPRPKLNHVQYLRRVPPEYVRKMDAFLSDLRRDSLRNSSKPLQIHTTIKARDSFTLRTPLLKPSGKL